LSSIFSTSPILVARMASWPPISVMSHSTLPESTMARSLPKSAGLVSTTRIPYFFS
jgi:hypothetical protein